MPKPISKLTNFSPANVVRHPVKADSSRHTQRAPRHTQRATPGAPRATLRTPRKSATNPFLWKGSRARFTRRQNAALRASGARFAYTPQVLVDGRDEPGWSRLPATQAATLRFASHTAPEPGATRHWVAVATDGAYGRPLQAVVLACAP
jgi:hypothetical protein